MKNCIVFALALLPLAIVGCSSGSPMPGEDTPPDATGSVMLEVATVPSDALCLDLAISATITTHRKFTLTPGQTASFSLTGLPLGSVTFTGNIYGVACSSVTSSTTTTWSSDSTSTSLSPTSTATLQLLFHHNTGRATIGVQFDDGGVPSVCNPTSPFGDAQPVDFAGFLGSRTDARLMPDELTVYLSSSSDLYFAARAARTDSFGTPALLSGLNSTAVDSHPAVTGDGLALFFDSLRAGTSHVYGSTRASIASAFSAPAQITALDGVGAAKQPYVVPSGTAVYFAADATPGNGQIFRASRSGGVVGAPQVMTPFNTTFDEGDPVATSDELTVFFSSTRTGVGEGGRDIWVSQRTSTAQPFGAPRNLQELNTFEDEKPSFVSADGCRLYFERGQGMYVAERGR